jgi:signal transduction histidine kinase
MIRELSLVQEAPVQESRLFQAALIVWSSYKNGVLSTRRLMDNPLAKYLSKDGHVDRKILDQLAYNEKMAELGRLSAGVIHEINTPLSVIAAASQMVLDEKGLSEFAIEMIERIHAEAHRLSQLTRGLLSFAREEDGQMVETDTNAVLREVLIFLRYEAQKRSVTITEEFDYQLAGINADANRLKQIFLNIIVNALHAMPDGGHLTVCTTHGENMVKIRIADTGAGIPKSVIKEIFEPFFSTKEPGQGTGLGLFITRNNVHALSGKIEVESEEGQGTCFTLYFPAIAVQV